MQPNDLGNTLRIAREAKGLRQEDVARACGVTQAAVQKWEAGTSIPRGPQKLSLLGEVLGLDTTVLQRPPVMTAYETRRFAADTLARALAVRQPAPPAYSGPETFKKIREERYAALASVLPSEMHKSIDQSIEIKGTRYNFNYLSRRVVVTALPVVSDRHVPPLYLRNAIFKHAIAQRFYNDWPITDRHYLVAAIGDGEPPRACLNEARMLDVLLETLPDYTALAARIVELEKKKTDLEEIQEANEASLNDWADFPPEM